MSVCPFPSREKENGSSDCSCTCTWYIENESCIFRLMSNEIVEMQRILRDNKKKLEVLLHINKYINETLNANEAFVQ